MRGGDGELAEILTCKNKLKVKMFSLHYGEQLELTCTFLFFSKYNNGSQGLKQFWSLAEY